MAQIGIIFGSNAGDAKLVAEHIASKFNCDIVDAKELDSAFLEAHQKFFFVASTHGDGELQKDFRAKLNLISEHNFSGKTIALVGIGGQVNHPTTFLDGMVEFLPLIRGAKLVGPSDIDGYKFTNSLALIHGRFICASIDVKNDANWLARADKWINSVKGDF